MIKSITAVCILLGCNIWYPIDNKISRQTQWKSEVLDNDPIVIEIEDVCNNNFKSPYPECYRMSTLYVPKIKRIKDRYIITFSCP